MEAAQRIRIVIADDSTIYRNNVWLMLRLQNDMEVVAEAGNGWSAIEQIKAQKPEVSLSDGKMGMPHDHLADYFYRRAGYGCKSGSVTSQVMGTQMDANQPSSFPHHNSGGVVAYREKPLFRSGA